jgi:hypothetical protein
MLTDCKWKRKHLSTRPQYELYNMNCSNFIYKQQLTKDNKHETEKEMNKTKTNEQPACRPLVGLVAGCRLSDFSVGPSESRESGAGLVDDLLDGVWVTMREAQRQSCSLSGPGRRLGALVEGLPRCPDGT